jgi:hypothetical protein
METIDAKDMMVGSIVLTDINRDGQFTPAAVKQYSNSTVYLYSLGEGKYTRWTSLLAIKPILLTPEWLEKLGFTLLSDVPIASDYGFYGWQWNKAFGVYTYVLVPTESSQWDLLSDSHYYAAVSGVHHLQALIWHLERVWLTIQIGEVEVAP